VARFSAPTGAVKYKSDFVAAALNWRRLQKDQGCWAMFFGRVFEKKVVEWSLKMHPPAGLHVIVFVPLRCSVRALNLLENFSQLRVALSLLIRKGDLNLAKAKRRLPFYLPYAAPPAGLTISLKLLQLALGQVDEFAHVVSVSLCTHPSNGSQSPGAQIVLGMPGAADGCRCSSCEQA